MRPCSAISCLCPLASSGVVATRLGKLILDFGIRASDMRLVQVRWNEVLYVGPTYSHRSFRNAQGIDFYPRWGHSPTQAEHKCNVSHQERALKEACSIGHTSLFVNPGTRQTCVRLLFSPGA